MKPIRHEYGTPRYAIAPGVESVAAIGPAQLAGMPPLPTRAGYYLLLWGQEGERWSPTDGLTYRLSAIAILVRES